MNKHVLYFTFGIPSASMTDFKISLYSNLISGLFTGIVAGLIVSCTMHTIETNKEKRSIQRENESILKNILYVAKQKLRLSDNMTLFGAGSNFLNNNFVNTIQYLEKTIIPDNNDTKSKSFGECIKIIKAAIHEYHEFIIIADSLDQLFKAAVLSHKKRPQMMSMEEALIRIYGLINNIDNSLIIQYSNVETYEKKEFVKDITNLPNLQKEISKYKSHRENFIHEMKKLQDILNTEDI